MPRFKTVDYTQTKMLPISFDRQILPGSFEYSLDYLIEHELDLSIFETTTGSFVTSNKSEFPRM